MKKPLVVVAAVLASISIYILAQTPGDFGAELNAQFAKCSSEPCSVKVPAGKHTYSVDIAFTRPTTLDCDPGAILDYQGVGYAVKMGPDGLVYKTQHYVPYSVKNCTFVGGAKARQGIYFNTFVTQTLVTDTHFIDFGNCEKNPFAIFYQSQNWWNLVDRVTMWGQSNHCMNGIKVNGADADGKTDYGQSRTIITNSLLQFDGGIGVFLNAFDSKIGPNVTVTGGMKMPIQIGSWGNRSAISHVYQETSREAKACIIYGDSSGQQAGNFISDLIIENSYCNLHNVDFKTVSRYIAPATPAAGLRRLRLYNNTITQSATGQELVQLNDLSGQDGNSADRNDVLVTLGKQVPIKDWNGGLHSKGKLISAWSGSDETTTAHN